MVEFRLNDNSSEITFYENHQLTRSYLNDDFQTALEAHPWNDERKLRARGKSGKKLSNNKTHLSTISNHHQRTSSSSAEMRQMIVRVACMQTQWLSYNEESQRV